MVKNSNSFRFDGRIRDFERTILDYQFEIFGYSSLSDTMGVILAYLSLYGELTQGQLKKLTNFSKSTISTSLSTLINIGYVRKGKIRHSREYKYYKKPRSQESIDFALGTMENEIAFFNEKILELENKALTRKKGYELILNRLKDALDVYECYQNIIRFLKNPSSKPNFDIKRKHAINLTTKDFSLIQLKLDPEIMEIEEEILNYFMFESAYSVLTDFSLKIYTLFLLRKVLTQERIREITGLSLGKVSQVVNALVRKGFIMKVEKKKYGEIIPEEIKRQTIYSMSSILESYFTSGINAFNEMLKWENDFKKIKNELLENKDELIKLNGHEEVLKFVNDYLEIIPTYKKAISLFSKFTS